MKKIILAIGLLLSLGMTHAFAGNGGDTNDAVRASFNKDFTEARNVIWEKQRDFIKATFNMNGLVLYAYYKADGELLAITRNLLSNQLPILLRGDLKKNYSDYWITDLFEVASGDQTSYYSSLENADEVLVLKSDGFNGWMVYKRIKKSSM